MSEEVACVKIGPFKLDAAIRHAEPADWAGPGMGWNWTSRIEN